MSWLFLLTFFFVLIGVRNCTCVDWVINCTFALYAARLLVEYKVLLRLLLSGKDAFLFYILSCSIRMHCTVYQAVTGTVESLEPTWGRICRGQAIQHTIVHTHACTLTLGSSVTLNRRAMIGKRGSDCGLNGAKRTASNWCSGSDQPKEYYSAMHSMLLYYPSFNKHRLPNGTHIDFREDCLWEMWPRKRTKYWLQRKHALKHIRVKWDRFNTALASNKSSVIVYWLQTEKSWMAIHPDTDMQ